MWAATSAFDIGPWRVGVRSSSLDVDAHLRGILGQHHVAAVEDGPPNYSLGVGDGANAGRKGVHRLYRGGNLVVRTREPARLVRGLLSHLSGLLEVERQDHIMVLAAGVVRDGEAVVVPRDLRGMLDQVQRRFDQARLQLVDTPWILIDPVTAELVVPEPIVEYDAAALVDFTREYPAIGRELAEVPPGRYPIRGWAFIPLYRMQGSLTRASALVEAFGVTLNLESFSGRRALEVLSRAIAGRDTFLLENLGPGGITADLVASFETR